MTGIDRRRFVTQALLAIAAPVLARVILNRQLEPAVLSCDDIVFEASSGCSIDGFFIVYRDVDGRVTMERVEVS